MVGPSRLAANYNPDDQLYDMWEPHGNHFCQFDALARYANYCAWKAYVITATTAPCLPDQYTLN
jgi:hypothetical protein